MGLTKVEGIISHNRTSVRLELLVDSGASYTVLPEKVWRRLQLTGKKKMKFVLTDGTEIEREISEAHLAVAGEEGHTPVILGRGSDVALLGVISLENLGLTLDPFQRRLQPMKMRLTALSC